MASKYAESARKLDSYNPAVFVNGGVCDFYKGDFSSAKIMFENALEIDPLSFEALYNMGKLKPNWILKIFNDLLS